MFCQKQLQRIALRMGNYELMVDGNSAFKDCRPVAFRIFESLLVERGELAALRVPVIQIGKLDSQYCCLEFVETAVEADFDMLIAILPPMISKASQSRREIGIATGNRSTVAISAQVFCGVEAEGAGDTEGANTTVAIAGTDCLRCIFDQPQVVA